MKLSSNWLKDYIDIKITPKELARKLTLSGTEVDGFDDLAEQYKNIVVAEILEVLPHTNADALQVAIVDNGKKKLQIVCGASNIAKSQKVPLALPGACLQGQIIEKTKIRGMDSQGMLCSAKELGLGDDHSGILVLSAKAKVGQSLAKVLGLNDTVFNLDLTPNRSDCLSVYGMAREISAILGRKIKYKKDSATPSLKIKKTSKDLKVVVKDGGLCPKYCALLIKNVTVGESPDWLKARLQSIGIRPINNIVDITNYIMMDMGQPMHAFDADRLGKKIVVRTAKKGETIKTLDNKICKLDTSTLLITDSTKPVAIAGVMGGADSEVSTSTKSIVLEAAIFNQASVRSTYRKLGLRTEAAIRFEKGLDWYMLERALNKGAGMIQDIAQGDVCNPIIRVADKDPKAVKFAVKMDYINTLLGSKFNFKYVKDGLNKLGISVSSLQNKQFFVVAPSWRKDLNLPADIVEEIGRVYDYNNLKPEPIKADINLIKKNTFFNFKYTIKQILRSLGYNEIYTHSFYKEADTNFAGGKHIELLNPTNDNKKYLRKSLVPLILRTASSNLRFFEKVNLFEIGRVFSTGTTILPSEDVILTGFCSHKIDAHYIYKELKGCISLLFKEIGINGIVFNKDNQNKHRINILHHKKSIGYIQFLDDFQKKEYKIRQEAGFFTLNLEKLFTLPVLKKEYKKIPAFPGVIRDLSLLVPKNVTYGDILRIIRKQGDYTRKVTLIDEYFSDKIGRSITVRIVFMSKQRTLENTDIEPIQQDIVSKLDKILKVKLR